MQNNSFYDYENEKSSLDVLLELIQKKKKNITEINILEITSQFLEYVEENKNLVSLDIYSDYAKMSAYLIELKTRSLLPNFDDNTNNTKKSIEEEREQFIKRLLEHQMYKNAIPLLENFKINRELYFDKEPEDWDEYLPNSIPYEKLPKRIDIVKLQEAFENILDKKYIKQQLQKPVDLHLSNNEYSLEEVIYDLIIYLSKHKNGVFLFDFFKSVDKQKQNIDYFCMLFFVMLSLIHQDNVEFIEKDNQIFIKINNKKFEGGSLSTEFIESIKKEIEGDY